MNIPGSQVCTSSKYVIDAARRLLANTSTGTVDDIAKVASFLASDDARWITGELIAVVGGMR